MAIRVICAALLLASLPIAGCGTAANLVKCDPGTDGKSPFGGVRHDVMCMKTAGNGDTGCGIQPDSASQQHLQAARTFLCAVDLPFSLIGDLLTWPYTAAYTYINQPVPLPPMAQAPADGRPPIVP